MLVQIIKESSPSFLALEFEPTFILTLLASDLYEIAPICKISRPESGQEVPPGEDEDSIGRLPGMGVLGNEQTLGLIFFPESPKSFEMMVLGKRRCLDFYGGLPLAKNEIDFELGGRPPVLDRIIQP
jgi:hypothetical protein